MLTNPELELALNFIKKTDRNVFLTGKAGTGKTTFLHKIKRESLKRMVVVAPTGVAAINAQGVTIHSFFQMPFGPILPNSIEKNTRFKYKFNKTKIDIIKSLDLVIIDEISMVRADLLDGIDQVLRRYKDKNNVFGGVQMLMIGDLQQLSPVVKPSEWELLRSYYETMYFFSSNSFQQANAISIELKHIYRQDNKKFIAILNEIRNNKLSSKSAEILNKRHNPTFVSTKNDGYITLTTHNNRADAMNGEKLHNLKTKSYFYSAEIKGKFNEYAYPTSENLELKVGAQVMFIKNDSSQEKRYFNGKIGVILSLEKNSVVVKCPEDDYEITTTPEIWENISYSLNQESKEITEDIAGSFSQIPLRLAWAITIHKSQGLTFEKAIIDAEASFAHGQTYVALSRCTSLEGIVLKTPIRGKSIINDATVANFNKNVAENTPDEKALHASQKTFQLNLIAELFNFHPFLYPVNRLIDIYYTNKSSFKGTIIEPLKLIKDKGIVPLLKVSTGFKKQLETLSAEVYQLDEHTAIQERFTKAVSYFLEQTETYIKTPIEALVFSTENQAVKKDFEKQLTIIENQLLIKMDCFDALKEHFNVSTYLTVKAKSAIQMPKKRKTAPIIISEHASLFEKLRIFRSQISEEKELPHFQIFTQKALYEICEMLPTTTKQLRSVNGMGKIRVEKYGNEILEIINTYCQTHKIVLKEDAVELVKINKIPTKQVSFTLFKEGLSVLEIAKKRELVTGTIEGHLSSYISTGDINVLEIIPEKRYQKLKKAIEKTTFENVSELKKKVNVSFSYNELRMMLIALEFEKTTSK